MRAYRKSPSPDVQGADSICPLCLCFHTIFPIQVHHRVWFALVSCGSKVRIFLGTAGLVIHEQAAVVSSLANGNTHGDAKLGRLLLIHLRTIPKFLRHSLELSLCEIGSVAALRSLFTVTRSAPLGSSPYVSTDEQQAEPCHGPLAQRLALPPKRRCKFAISPLRSTQPLHFQSGCQGSLPDYVTALSLEHDPLEGHSVLTK